MIRVDRTAIQPPAELTSPGSAGLLERDAAVAYYTAATWDKKTSYSKFEAYKLTVVKRALAELFHGKCAYCESKYIATQPMDVEHYRPKAAVVIRGKTRKPGYYWLAANWENLLPSCTDCNRAREQEIPGEDPQVVGKANRFPLGDEAKRWRKHDADCEEEPLLLNPCADKPERHLKFMKDGTVYASLKENRRRDPRGLATIRVCGLQRRGLVAERRDHARLILTQRGHVRDTAGDWARASGGEKERLRRRLRRALAELKVYMRPDQRYSAMARQLIDPFLEGLGLK